MTRPAALPVIDMQRDFCEPEDYAATGMTTPRLQAPIPNIRRLLAAARASHMVPGETVIAGIAGEGGILGAVRTTEPLLAAWREAPP